MSNILCPLTKRENIEKVESIDAKTLIEQWNSSLSIDISDELAGISKIDLYRCNETGLRFFVPDSVAGSERLYAQLQKFDWFYMSWKWEHKILFSRLNAGEKILEVGCATGSFIEKLCSAGFDSEGIEFNLAAVAKAQEKKLPVSSIDMFELSKRKAVTFDVVCSFQVLEHVSDPGAFIENSIALLKTKGRLVICVPNNESFLKYQYNLLNMPPHHMTQWSFKTFQTLEKLYPLRLSCVKYESLASYHIDEYIGTYQNRLIAINKLNRILFNRYSMPVIRFALKSGLRRLCRGQSIYVEFIKL